METIWQFADGDRGLSHKQPLDDNIRCRVLADGGIFSVEINLALTAGQKGQGAEQLFFNVSGAHGKFWLLTGILYSGGALIPEAGNIGYAAGRMALSDPVAILARIQYDCFI